MTCTQLIAFHALMAKELGIKYVFDPGFLQRILQRRLESILGPFADVIPLDLRPMCIANVVFLPYAPGTPGVPWLQQVRTVIHEGDHALNIREYPERAAVWYQRYFLSAPRRALVEASARTAEMEFLYWYDRVTPTLNISRYLLNEVVMREALNIYLDDVTNVQTLGRGYTTHNSAAAAIRVFRKLGIDRVENKE